MAYSISQTDLSGASLKVKILDSDIRIFDVTGLGSNYHLFLANSNTTGTTSYNLYFEDGTDKITQLKLPANASDIDTKINALKNLLFVANLDVTDNSVTVDDGDVKNITNNTTITPAAMSGAVRII